MATEPQGKNTTSNTRVHTDIVGLRDKRVLYVDDDRLAREVTRRMLRRAGAHCFVACTHDEAVALAGAEAGLTVAMLDYHMPDGPIARLVKRLHLLRPALPLIGTSAVPRHREFVAIGVPHFLEKPWDTADLARAVNRVCASTPRSAPLLSLDSRETAGA